MSEKITVEGMAHASIDMVWEYYTEPQHIVKWNHASDDWCSPWAKNDLRAGGNFVFRMEACDGSEGFDFSGQYTEVKKHELIAYTIEDGRRVTVRFVKKGDKTQIKVVFEAENINSVEMQREGWQAILNNFIRCVDRIHN